MYRRALLRSGAGMALDDPAVRVRAAGSVIAARCAVGEHRQETDAETGNEVCRWCKKVLDDYEGVAPWTSEQPSAKPGGAAPA
jgi:hypothetical protein